MSGHPSAASARALGAASGLGAAAWTLIRYASRPYLVTAVIWTCFLASPLLPGLVVRWFFDGLSGARAVRVGSAATLLLVVAVGRIASIAVGVRFDVQYRLAIRQRLLARLFQRLLQFGPPGGQGLPPGETTTRLRDDVAAIEQFLSSTIDLLGYLVFCAACTGLLIRIDPLLPVAVFFPVVLVAWLASRASAAVQRRRERALSSAAASTSVLEQSFAAVRLLQGAGAEDHVARRLDRLNAARAGEDLRDKWLALALRAVFSNASALGTGLMLLVAAAFLDQGRLTLGDLALSIYLLGFVTVFVDFFGQFTTAYRQTAVSLRRLHEVLGAGLAAAPDEAATSPGGTPAPPLERFSVAGLSSSAPDQEGGVEGVDLELGRGALVVVTGPIGAGKSTLLRAVVGLLPIHRGTLRWNGAEVTAPERFMRPPRCAYVAQVPRLFEGTVRDNLLLGWPAGEDELKRAVQLSRFEQDLAQLPRGLDTDVGPGGARLSGGQVQRLAVARALVRSPQLLVVDDLSSALDVETERRLWAGLRAEPGLTVLAVAHRRAVLELADAVVWLERGRVRAVGNAEQLLGSLPEFRSLWETGGLERRIEAGAPATRGQDRHSS